MASAFGHAAVALTASTFLPKEITGTKVALIGIVLSILPDIDVLSFRLGIPYEHWLGHRGLTHSLTFSALIALLVSFIFHRGAGKKGLLWLYYFVCAASHGLLDAMTSGGRGTGFFIPFHNERYFLPFRPIKVSPIEMEDFFSDWGMRVLGSEFIWIVLPCLGIFLISRVISQARA